MNKPSVPCVVTIVYVFIPLLRDVICDVSVAC